MNMLTLIVNNVNNNTPHHKNNKKLKFKSTHFNYYKQCHLYSYFYSFHTQKLEIKHLMNYICQFKFLMS